VAERAGPAEVGGPALPSAPPAAAAELGELGERVVAKLLDGAADPAGHPVLASACGGAFLLLRAVLDSGLAGIASRLGYPTTTGPAAPGALLAALALRWAGTPVAEDRPLDPALGLLAGLPEPPTLPSLREAFAAAGPADHARFQAALLEVLARLRLLGDPEAVHLHRVPLADGEAALVAGDGAAGLWPLALAPADAADLAEVAAGWVAAWAAATGTRPRRLVCDQELGAALEGRLDDLTVTPVVDPAGPVDGEPAELADLHRGSRKALTGLLGVLGQGRLGLAYADLTVGLTAGALLRVWARWLQRFAGSSAPYLLDQFVRRSATVVPDTGQVLVELEPRPLDLVLEMTGYTAPLEHLPWLQGRRVVFRVGPA
jgi:hypothetical protein